MQYRADIDGLRALAVIPVVLFHVGVTAVSGGFVGVDVFFVISGFLITSLVLEDVRRGQFSLGDFYERRARRILPPLFLVMASSSIAAWMLFLPRPLEDFAQSLIAATVFSSNIFFWWQVGYFDAPAELKPLLHTWSLAVEEQFYLIFPPIFLLLIRRSKYIWTLLLLALLAGSFLLSVWAVRKAPSAAFYLLPFRAWELMLGALLASPLIPRWEGRLVASMMSLAGVVLIGYAIFTYDQSMHFPGRAAAVPCLGAALLIHAGSISNDTLVGRFLTWPLMTGIGLISYSLYLWHWPIIVFARYWSVTPPSMLMSFAMVATSFALAYVSWRWLENPVRKKRRWPTRPDLGVAMGACAAIFLFYGAAGVVAEGWPIRINEKVLALADQQQFFHDKRDCHFASKKQLADLCVRGAQAVAPDFILVGDSHADALSPGLFAAATAANRAGYQFTDGGYRPAFGFDRLGDDEKRINKLDQALRELLVGNDNIRDIFVMAYWSAAMKNQYVDRDGERRSASFALQRSLTEFAKINSRVKVHLVEDNPVAPQLSPVVAAQAIHFGKQPAVGISRPSYDKQLEMSRELLSALAKHRNVQVVSLADHLCDDSFCQSTAEDKPLYRDDNHLSPDGAKRLEGLFYRILDSPSAGNN